MTPRCYNLNPNNLPIMSSCDDFTDGRFGEGAALRGRRHSDPATNDGKCDSTAFYYCTPPRAAAGAAATVAAAEPAAELAATQPAALATAVAAAAEPAAAAAVAACRVPAVRSPL